MTTPAIIAAAIAAFLLPAIFVSIIYLFLRTTTQAQRDQRAIREQQEAVDAFKSAVSATVDDALNAMRRER